MLADALLTFGDRLLPARVGVDRLGVVPNRRGQPQGLAVNLQGSCRGDLLARLRRPHVTETQPVVADAAKRPPVGRSRGGCHRRLTVRPSPRGSVRPRPSGQVRLNPSANCIWNVPRPSHHPHNRLPMRDLCKTGASHRTLRFRCAPDPGAVHLPTGPHRRTAHRATRKSQLFSSRHGSGE